MQVVVNKFLDPLNTSADNFNPKQDGSHLNSHGSYYGNLLSCLDCNPLNPPLADLLRQYYQLNGKWLVASLTHWEVTHNDVMITRAKESLQLTESESQTLFLAVREFLKAYHLDVLYHDAFTWLININNHATINSVSVDSIQHRSLMPVLEKLDPTLFWQRLLTELQMFLNSSIQNVQANPAVNGLWFWGEGEFTFSISKPVITDDEVLLHVLNLGQKSRAIELTDSLIPQRGDVILIKYPERINFNSFQEKIKKNAVQWYWNNVTYSVSAKGWRRLWR